MQPRNWPRFLRVTNAPRSCISRSLRTAPKSNRLWSRTAVSTDFFAMSINSFFSAAVSEKRRLDVPPGPSGLNSAAAP